MELNGAVKILFTTATEGMDDATRRIAKGASYKYLADTPFDRVPAVAKPFSFLIARPRPPYRAATGG